MAARKRTSQVERELLVRIMAGFIGAIESKQTEARASNRKQHAWKELTQEYNKQSTSAKKTTLQLQTAWDRLKQKAKKDAREFRLASVKTGGGPAPMMDPLSDAIVTMIPQQFVSLANTADNDTSTIQLCELRFLRIFSFLYSNDL
jgi:hypothetical protein